MKEANNLNNDQYNSIPVFYCRRCLSLKIMNDEDMCYCDKCGSVDIGEESIFTWIKRYELKYDKIFFDIENIRRLRSIW